MSGEYGLSGFLLDGKMKLVALLLFLASGAARGDEAECLADIMYQEARGESLEGVVAIGQAAIQKAKRERSGVCKLKGVKRQRPHRQIVDYYTTLARQLISKPSISVSLGADHWDKGKPHLPGKVTRSIGKHTFYVLEGK